MDYGKILCDNQIVICNNSIKKEILNYMNTITDLYSISFMNFDDIKKHLFFDYDKKAIYYLMKKDMPYEVAEMYIDNMYYVSDIEYKNEKLNKLVEYKKELENNKLLNKDDLFEEFIKNKKIIVISRKLSKYQEYLISILKKYTEVDIYEYSSKKYEHEFYEFNTLDEEIEYVAYNICELLSKGIDINKIKIANIDDDYRNSIKRIFSYFNIPINLPSNSYLIGSKIAKDFLENYNSNINVTINLLEKYSGNPIYDSIIDICNKYTFIDDYLEVKDMIIHDFSNTLIPLPKYKNAVEVVDMVDVPYSSYVFLMNFNLKSIPRVYKDEDYITDDIKPDYLDKTLDKNIREKELVINSISNIENLVITYKNITPTGECYPSNLVSKDLVSHPKIDIYKSYSIINDKLKLAAAYDKLIKYGNKDENLNALNYNYDIEYMKYDNSYKKVNKDIFQKTIQNGLSLSYSSLNKYNECPFKYYLSDILKLDIYEERFEAILGTIFHHVLEIGISKDIDVNDEIKLFLNEKYKNRVFSKKETFFIKNASKNIEFVLKIIKKQMQFCKLNGVLTEKKVYFSKDKNVKITFTGIIDKILYGEDGNNTIVALIDYKTGNNTEIDLNYMEYGIGLQLPIYILLTKHMDFKNVKFAGIYLQKVMPDIEKVGDKLSKEDKLKLEGYSNADKNIIEKFDITCTSSSVIKGLRVTTSGNFDSRSKVLTNDKFEELAELADSKIDECINNIINTNFDIRPIQKQSDQDITACKYCNFKDICYRKNKDIKYIKKMSAGGDNND